MRISSSDHKTWSLQNYFKIWGSSINSLPLLHWQQACHMFPASAAGTGNIFNNASQQTQWCFRLQPPSPRVTENKQKFTSALFDWLLPTMWYFHFTVCDIVCDVIRAFICWHSQYLTLKLFTLKSLWWSAVSDRKRLLWFNMQNLKNTKNQIVEWV